ncbi:MAG: transketolase [SAR324 cluster bacterium]|nr:transketolase [SAR324 cluster bacterium]
MTQLSYISSSEIDRILNGIAHPLTRCEVFANLCRINTLYMISFAGSGHIGSSFSCLDIMSYLWLEEMNAPNEPGQLDGDLFYSSKGHDIPGFYSLLIGLKKLDFSLIHQLRRLNGLPGHPDRFTPYVITNTGSLGMGISKARGMTIAKRLNGNQGRVFVILGDGELQEGQIWESLQATANGQFGEINVIVDHNKIQSDTWVSNVNHLGDLETKFKAYGWVVARCNGHDVHALQTTFAHFQTIHDRPKILIADTIKGRGVSFMETLGHAGESAYYKFHSGAPSREHYEKAVEELIENVNQSLQKNGLESLKLETSPFPTRIQPTSPQKLVSAYTNELLSLAEKHEEIVALDADLVLDTGLIPFKNVFPQRFIECGIAEQDMVSVAGGLALMGKLPIVHSFACFLSTRPNEQIYNNSTEKTKIIYVGSLAGLLPGGPGHSHQSVRDISALSAMPELTLIEPCNETEVRAALRWAVENNTGSTYLRLVSIPCEVPYTLPKDYLLEKGKGHILTEGHDAILLTYGPVLLSEAVKASVILKERDSFGLKVVNFPWLNAVDVEWMTQLISSFQHLFVMDNHYIVGGFGSFLASALSDIPDLPRMHLMGVKSIPCCGQNAEVLVAHELDASNIVEAIRSLLINQPS